MVTSSSNSTDSSLLRRVQADDAAAWGDFIDLYGPLLFYWARRGGLDAADAADVIQETLTAVARGIRDFQHANGQGSLRGWLWMITRNKLQDFYRRPEARAVGGTDCLKLMQALPEVPPDELEPGGLGQMSALLHRALRQVEAEFEPRTWQAFWRVVVENQATAIVAQDLGLSANSVRQAKSRVLRRLREQVGEWPE